MGQRLDSLFLDSADCPLWSLQPVTTEAIPQPRALNLYNYVDVPTQMRRLTANRPPEFKVFPVQITINCGS